MRNLLMSAAFLLGVATSVSVQAAPAAQAFWPVKDVFMAGWKVFGGTNGIFEGFNYSLYNTDQKLYSRYEDRVGANLGWNSNLNNAMKIKRLVSSSEPIKCEEPFALFVGKEWFIHGSQTFGINLTSRSSLTNPDWYQWRFTKCGAPGTVVQLNTSVALVNSKTNTAVVGCKRIWGVNLCWAEDVITFRGKNYRLQDIKSLVSKGLVSAEILKLLP